MDTKTTGGFKSLGEFLIYVRKFYSGEYRDGRLKDLVEKTAGHMAEADDSQGGFIVPELWAEDIRYAAMEGAIVRPRAIVLPVTTDTLHVRTLVDTSRASNIFGGITFIWRAEASDKTAIITKPSIGLTTLNIHKLVGSTWVSNELENDVNGFGAFMELAYGRAIRFLEDDVFLWGQGVGQPLGILYSNALVTVTRTGVGALVWKDLANMAARLLPDSWNRAVFLVNPDALDNLLQMVAAAANTVAHFDVSQRRWLGIPIIPSEHCASMGALGDVILADFGQYVIGDREMSVASSREVSASGVGFPTDETFWRIVLRVDGQPLINAPITPKRGGATLSPFVALSVTS